VTDTEHLVATLHSQGRACAALGSPMYGELLDHVVADVQARGAFAAVLSGRERDPGRLAVPLRLLGGLHRLVLDGRAPALRRWYPSTGGTWNADAAWPDIIATATEHVGPLRAALHQPPQTNEVGRSAALVGGLLMLRRQFHLPVRLFEIGASAGLNLRADHYQYRYRGGHWGPDDSPVRIADAWRGNLPPTDDLPITERNGYDIAPIDATSREGELTLLSYVWPDMAVRMDRLRGAISIARRVPARLQRSTAADAVAELAVADGALTVLWHSITWQYLSAEEQAAVRTGIDAVAAGATARAPFAHLMLEPQRRTPDTPHTFLLRVRSWPGGDDRVLAECAPHGPPVVWECSPRGRQDRWRRQEASAETTSRSKHFGPQ
jgi:hypothetical protein